MLKGRYTLERVTDGADIAGDNDMLVLVNGPDGPTRMRRNGAAETAWVALWNGDDAHATDSTGMLSPIVVPLAAGAVPVWVASTFDGNLVLVPEDRLDEAIGLVRQAGHRVAN